MKIRELSQYPVCCVPGDLNLCDSLGGDVLAFRGGRRLVVLLSLGKSVCRAIVPSGYVPNLS
jgi:hypothetical protein